MAPTLSPRFRCFVAAVLTSLLVLTVGIGVARAQSAPVITAVSPARQVIAPGDGLDLGVTATSVTALSYQWKRNGQPISGATNANYSVEAVTRADAGAYQVTVRNSDGATTSALMFVLVAPVVTEVRAWGMYRVGQTYVGMSVPPVLSEVIAIAGASHSLALKEDGTVVAWGDNTQGQCDVPPALIDVVAIAATGSGSLALKADGSVVAWGKSEENAPPPDLANIIAIAASSGHLLALTAEGAVSAWGFNYSGQATVPAGLADVIAIAAGTDHSLALKADGTIVAWGDNSWKQCDVPAGLAGVKCISAGRGYSVALLENGQLVVWGTALYGDSAILSAETDVIAMSAGAEHLLGVRSDGSVFAAGYGGQGQTWMPPSLTQVIDVAAGAAHSLALRDATKDRAPEIITEPVDQTVVEGAYSSLTVEASGGQAVLNYQWRKDGVDIAGETWASFRVANVRLDQAGDYDVVVTNVLGSTVSHLARLTVNPLPVIDGQSALRQVLTAGGPFSLSVAARGSGPLTYQWFRNNRPIEGATHSSLERETASAADSGAYVVEVTDAIGTRRSTAMFALVSPGAMEVRSWGSIYDTASRSYKPMMVPLDVSPAFAVSGGGSHGLALKSTGLVLGWGNNEYGQTTIPVGLHEVVAISAGDRFSSALQADGTVVVWGYNGDGVCAVPAELKDVVAISAGAAHILALKADGTVRAWGNNFYNQSKVPTDLKNVVAVSAGAFHSIALKSDGAVVAWGDNSFGQTAVPVNTTGVVAIAAGGHHTLALKQDGMIEAWGDDEFGQTDVPAVLADVTAISAGSDHSLALRANGAIVGWGSNIYSQSVVPAGIKNVFAIAAGGQFSVALRDGSGDVVPDIDEPIGDRAVVEGSKAVLSVRANGGDTWLRYQWRKDGVDLPGETGPMLVLDEVVPSDAGRYEVVVGNWVGSVASSSELTVSPLPKVSSQSPSRQVLAPGEALELSVTATGTGELGYQWFRDGRPLAGATEAAYNKAAVERSDNGAYVLAITDDVGTRRSAPMFIMVDGGPREVIVWGSNSFGLTAVPSEMTEAIAISAGDAHSLILKRDGTVVAWGFNLSGQTDVPVGLMDVVAISAGDSHSLALKADGRVVAWGSSQYGVTTNVPAGLANVIAIEAGSGHSLALRSDGTVVAWGYNESGQCNVPSGLRDVVVISAGGSHSLALKRDGTVVGWGRDDEGQVTIPADLSGAIAIAAGRAYSLAATADGRVVGWGSNSRGMTNIPAGLNNVIALDANEYFSLALKGGGTVVGWGETVPSGLTNVLSIAVGHNHAMVLRDISHDGPTITAEPVSRTAIEGNSVVFAVTAESGGNLSLAFQWRKNGADLVGATNATLTLSAVDAGDGGDYDVVVSNVRGVVTSAAATLVVRSLPSIVEQSARREVLEPGEELALSVAATGTGALTYQWFQNGKPIPGATEATLTQTRVKTSDAGVYTVVVMDNVGSRRSTPRFVLVAPASTRVAAWGWNYDGQASPPSDLEEVIAVAGGMRHSLALKRDGTVVAWGDNNQGQTDVPSELNNVVAIGAGSSFSVALKADGTVAGWGHFWDGRQYVPMSVPSNFTDVTSISVGHYHVAAVKGDGTVATWGPDIFALIPLPQPADVIAVAVGERHTLALKADGTVVAWGTDLLGAASVPSGLTNVVAIAASGFNSFALKADGTVVSWGSNAYGQASVPAGLLNVAAITAGRDFAFVCEQGGILVGWGQNNQGQTSPPPNLGNVIAMAAGYSHMLAITSEDGRPVALPSVSIQTPTRQVLKPGQALSLTIEAEGTGTLSYQWFHDNRPIDGATGASYGRTAVAAEDAGAYYVVVTDDIGAQHSASMFVLVAPAITQVRGWGGNDRGQIAIPARLDDAVALSAGYAHSLALRADGSIVGWGDNTQGQATAPDGLTDAVAVAANYFHSVALKADGTVVAWGSNSYGQSIVPAGLTDVVAVAAGYFHALALKADGTVVAWGSNSAGEATVPAGLSNVVGIAAGNDYSLALKADGTVVAWGVNISGQTTVPVDLMDVTAITAGAYHSLALRADGSVAAWGGNSRGEIMVPSGLAQVVAIAAGQGYSPATPTKGFSLALKADGRVTAWGDDAQGQSTVPREIETTWAIAAGGYHALALRDATRDTEPTIVAPPADQVIAAGHGVTFTVVATGTPAPLYQWYKDGVAIVGATDSIYTISAADTGAEGRYTVTVTNAAGSVTSAAGMLKVNPASYLSNLSVRAMVNGETLIVGFVVEGSKPVLVRAAGPYLTGLGLNLQGLPDPGLTLFTATGAPAKENDDWNTELTEVFERLGAGRFANGSKDAAFVETISGPHTAHVTGAGRGMVLAEVYDAGEEGNARLMNVSARYLVGTGDDVLIAGFAIGGAGTKQVLIRAVGPSLPSIVTNRLANPQLAVYDAEGALIASNDNWPANLAPVFDAVGAGTWVEGSKDAALLIALPAGLTYTVHVSGVGETTGEALVEIYDVW